MLKKSKKTLETTISRILGFHVGVLGDYDPHFVEAVQFFEDTIPWSDPGPI